MNLPRRALPLVTPPRRALPLVTPPRRALPRGGAALVALALAAATHAQQDPAGELEALRRAIDEHRQRVLAFEQQERGLLETVEEMDRAAEALAADARRARREARAARARLGEVERQRAEIEARLARTQRALGARAVALYKAGELGPVGALFSADTLPEALGRIRMLRRLVAHDQDLVSRFRGEVAALAEVRSEALVVADRRDAAARRSERRAAQLDRERRGRREVLESVRGDRARARAALNELEAAARALEETLSLIREQPAGPRPGGEVPFARLRGLLPPPVDAPVVARFGRVVDRQFSTQTLRKGVDFGTRIGDPVRAVAAGVVRFAGWFRGYGKLVILDHGDDFFTVFGHLDEIDVEVGGRVAEGEALGRAGETGSLDGPRLYFEVRQGGEAQDPAEWLGAR